MIDRFAALLPEGCVRGPRADDPFAAELGSVPRCVVRPADEQQCAATLALAAELGAAVVPWGGGQHQRIGNLPRADVVLLTTGMVGVVAHDVADQTIAVRAGTRLKDLAAQVERHGQWLPLDPAGADLATIGGVIAAGVSGPLRTGHGLGRDMLLGTRSAHPDGTVTKSGGQLVKNVTGFDLHRLYHGSLGTLAVLTQVNLRLFPRPERSLTLVLPLRTTAELDAWLVGLNRSASRPSALSVLDAAAASRAGVAMPQDAVMVALLRRVGDRPSVARSEEHAVSLLEAPAAQVVRLEGEDEQRLWQRVREDALPWRGEGAVFKLVYLPMHGERSVLGEILAVVAALARTLVVVAEPLLGVLRLGVQDAAAGAVIGALTDLHRPDDGRLLRIEAAPPALRRGRDVHFGALPAVAMQRRVLGALDPAGVLSPGRLFEENRR